MNIRTNCRLDGGHVPAKGIYRDYDLFAWFYNRYWDRKYHSQALPVLDELVLLRLPANAWILDLCCGTGHLARILSGRGFRVTGIDGSREMLRYARENVPDGEFIAADARSFNLPPIFQAIVSTFESLNHISSVGELTMVFHNAHAALIENGLFVFDLIMEEAYLTRWGKSSAIVEKDNVCVVRGGYNPAVRIGRTDITMFRLDGNWRRSDVTLLQRCYSEEEVRSALELTGFSGIRLFRAGRDFSMPGDLGTGRTFFLATKESSVEERAEAS